MIGKRVVFKTPYQQYRHYDGEKGIVLRELTDEERDPEVGTMYRLKLDNHGEISVWPEEIDGQFT